MTQCWKCTIYKIWIDTQEMFLWLDSTKFGDTYLSSPCSYIPLFKKLNIYMQLFLIYGKYSYAFKLLTMVFLYLEMFYMLNNTHQWTSISCFLSHEALSHYLNEKYFVPSQNFNCILSMLLSYLSRLCFCYN